LKQTLILLIALQLTLGCMTRAPHQKPVPDANGVYVVPDDEVSALQKELMLQRSPDIWTYASPQQNNQTPAQVRAYDALNSKLHEKIASVLLKHFSDHPIPEAEKDRDADWLRDRERYEFYTHQNWDWYGPSQECYVVVLASEIDMELVKSLQSLLQGEYANWEIVLIGSNDFRMDNDYELVLFSDAIIVPESFEQAYRLATGSPNKHRDRGPVARDPIRIKLRNTREGLELAAVEMFLVQLVAY